VAVNRAELTSWIIEAGLFGHEKKEPLLEPL